MSEWIRIFLIIAPITDKISFAFWIITVPFYTLMVFALIHAQIKKAPILTGSFFKLCITAGINDIVTLLNHYFGTVFPNWVWFTKAYLAIGKPYVYIYLIIAWSSTINQALSVSLLVTNRLSALVFSLRYHQLWRGFRLKFAMSVQIVPGYIFAFFILFHDVKLLRLRTGALKLGITDQRVYIAYCKAAMIFLMMNSLFLIVAYCYLFYAMRKRNKIQSKVVFTTRIQRTRNRKKCRRAEFRLFVMSSVIVAMQLFILLIFSTKVLPRMSIAISLVRIFYNPINVLYSGVSAYLLWVCSDALRRYVLALLKIKRKLAARIYGPDGITEVFSKKSFMSDLSMM